MTMGTVPTPKATPAPPQPETVKRADSERRKVRGNAATAATGRAGFAATDLTRGALAMTGPVLKQKLGGGE